LSDSIIFEEECVLTDMETNHVPSEIQTQVAQQAADVNSCSPLKCIPDSQSPVHATSRASNDSASPILVKSATPMKPVSNKKKALSGQKKKAAEIK
jgi:hypothetical protein